MPHGDFEYGLKMRLGEIRVRAIYDKHDGRVSYLTSQWAGDQEFPRSCFQ